MATVTRDRRAELAIQTLLNGIDFVEVVNPTQTHLRVHFLQAVPDVASLRARITKAEITGGDTIPAVAVLPFGPGDWATTAAGLPTLDLHVGAPGDFSAYTLRLLREPNVDPILDPFFDRAVFSFKAQCPSIFDCRTRPEQYAPSGDSPPIDYLAKDFNSFRTALLNFSALHYPEWQERSEADFGVMFLEALASVADDLSYQQDRIAAEAWIETATERRSLVRLARLVDYEPVVAVAAHTWLQFTVAGSLGFSIPRGVRVSALAPDGTYVDFETGRNLRDRDATRVEPSWNPMIPHWWDDAQRFLRRDATEIWLPRPAADFYPGQRLVIDTAGETSADPPNRELVTILDWTPETDPLYRVPLAHVRLRREAAIRSDRDLRRTTVAGNLVPATHGRTQVDAFVIADDASAVTGTPAAIVRTGANGTLQYLHTLRAAPLAWLAQDNPNERPHPELRVIDRRGGEEREWTWIRSLLKASELEYAVTIDPVRYRTIDAANGVDDYDGDDGATLRFGDGVFGIVPAAGLMFEATYRTGGGARGNVAADSVTRLDPSHPLAPVILSVTNPLAASGGRDEEPDDHVREIAPQDFRVTPYRAVRAEDYERAATRLSWVQRAGTSFRYTGSWLSVFTAVDPVGSASLPDGALSEVTNVLDRYRLAGYESFALAPRYASLDIRIIVCVLAEAFRADVVQGVLAALDATVHGDGRSGFFHPDRFTFGMPLERSALEADIQDVPGVDGVIDMFYRRRGYTPGFILMPDVVQVARDEIVRVDSDPNRPERGSVHVEARGGK